MIPALGALTLTVPIPPGPGTSDYLLYMQPTFAGSTGEKVLGTPFRIRENPGCGYFVHCLSASNSTGVASTIGATGTPSVAANDLILIAQQLPVGEMGMFFYGHSAAQGWNPSGDGLLCVQAPLFRLRPATVASAQGTASLAIDLNSAPMNGGPGAILAGHRVYFQYVYRDSQSPGSAGFNYSNGLTVEYCP